MVYRVGLTVQATDHHLRTTSDEDHLPLDVALMTGIEVEVAVDTVEGEAMGDTAVGEGMVGGVTSAVVSEIQATGLGDEMLAMAIGAVQVDREVEVGVQEGAMVLENNRLLRLVVAHLHHLDVDVPLPRRETLHLDDDHLLPVVETGLLHPHFVRRVLARAPSRLFVLHPHLDDGSTGSLAEDLAPERLHPLIRGIAPDLALGPVHPPLPLLAAAADLPPLLCVVMSVTTLHPVGSGTTPLPDVETPALHRGAATTIHLLVDEKTVHLLADEARATAVHHRQRRGGARRCRLRHLRRTKWARRDEEFLLRKTGQRRSWMGHWPKANGRIENMSIAEVLFRKKSLAALQMARCMVI